MLVLHSIADGQGARGISHSLGPQRPSQLTPAREGFTHDERTLHRPGERARCRAERRMRLVGALGTLKTLGAS